MTESDPGYAPSEDFTLHCDVPTCESALAMIHGIKRSEHGWGRITVYDDTVADALVVLDYDLCNVCFKGVQKVLRGES